jgi:hypothetical protein
MANTYTQIYVQVVFAVEGRQNLIRPERREELQNHITAPYCLTRTPTARTSNGWKPSPSAGESGRSV